VFFSEDSVEPGLKKRFMVENTDKDVNLTLGCVLIHMSRATVCAAWCAPVDACVAAL